MAPSAYKVFLRLGRSPGLVVMGGDSCSECRGFESIHNIPTGWTFFMYICCKNCFFLFQGTKINEKEARDGPFLNKNWPYWEVVVAQLVEQSLPIPEVRGSNPVIGKILFISIEQLYTVNCFF